MLDDTINSAWVVGGCPGVPQTVIVCRLCQTMFVEYRHLSPRHLLQVSSTKRSICQYHSVWKWGIPIYTQMATLTDTNKIISYYITSGFGGTLFSDCYPVAWFLHAFFGSRLATMPSSFHRLNPPSPMVCHHFPHSNCSVFSGSSHLRQNQHITLSVMRIPIIYINIYIYHTRYVGQIPRIFVWTFCWGARHFARDHYGALQPRKGT